MCTMLTTSTPEAVLPRLCRAIPSVLVCAIAFGCTSVPRSEESAADRVGRPTLLGTEAQSLQSSLMALADTSMQRIASEPGLGRKGGTPEERRDDMNTRVVLSSALIAIAMQPDPVDALADMLTHTTLTADAQRVAAMGKSADTPEARLLQALQQNDADAWQLAEQWVNEPTRVAFRARILAWEGNRTSAVGVAFVRLTDIKRAGSTSVESGGGMFDSLRTATAQMDQTRLLAERSLFLAQRFPFLMRWQTEVYTGNALATKEAQQTQAQIERMSAIMTSMSQLLAGLAEQVSRERQATFTDLFSHVSSERQATLDQVELIVQKQRKAILEEAGAVIDVQRQATLQNLLALTDSAGKTLTRSLFIGGILIVLLLLGLLGILLLYRRLAGSSLPSLARHSLTSGATQSG